MNYSIEEQAEILASLAEDGEGPPPPYHAPNGVRDEGWRPDLNPTQQLIFDDPSLFILGYGEKGSGKSIGFGHKLVRHSYENWNSFFIIIAPTVFTGSEGIWQDLETLILPAWRDGNRYPPFLPDGVTPHPQAGELKDGGMGLEYTDSRLDPQTKDKIIWIGNRFGGWSKLVLKSIPFPAQVQDRIKGPAPSGIYVEELTNCQGREYLIYPAAQLGRRRGITGPQQFLASCNPDGPKHWVHKELMEVPGKTSEEIEILPLVKAREKGGIGRGAYDSDYSVYHVPIIENVHRIGGAYIRNLEKIFANDPIERMRLIDGVWIDRPSGDAIFKDYFTEQIHVRGDAKKNLGLVPIKGHPIIVGYDPGPVNFSVHFEQFIPLKDKMLWLVFDELDFVGQRVPYFKVVPMIMRRMGYWRDRLNHPFVFEHISDEAAFNQLRPDGSFDAAEIERLSAQYLRINPLPFPPLRLRACPKGNDSVPARVRMVGTLLQQECLYISALCPKTIEMFKYLEAENEKNGKYDPLAAFRPKRSVHIHRFDSMSYPMFYFSAWGFQTTPQTDRVEPQVYSCGS